MSSTVVPRSSGPYNGIVALAVNSAGVIAIFLIGGLLEYERSARRSGRTGA